MYVYSVLDENNCIGISQRLVSNFEKAKKATKQFFIEDINIDIPKEHENIEKLLKYKKDKIKEFEDKLTNAKEGFSFIYTGINECQDDFFYITIEKIEIE